MKKTALVVFKKSISEREKKYFATRPQVEVVVSFSDVREEVMVFGHQWRALEDFVEPGSIYEASTFAEELSRLSLPDGTRISKMYTYKEYELWWIHYNKLYLYGCLPYTQYKKLLLFLTDFQQINFYRLPFKNLFSCYLEAHGCEMKIVPEIGIRSPSFLPLGVVIQIFISLLSLPVLLMRWYSVMVFTSDLFEKSKDYDFRMKFIYEELRQRKIPFIECIRSLESSKIVLAHALVRKRPVIYSEGVALLGQYMSRITGGRYRMQKKCESVFRSASLSADGRFKLLLAIHPMMTFYEDIWTIRIARLLLRVMGIKTMYVAAALDRNFHMVIAAKLNTIPIVGILHGVASLHYNTYDFLPGYDGVKSLSVDRYGLWSEWWRDYYVQNSSVYKKEQLYISGPMRPLVERKQITQQKKERDTEIKVLFVSEQLAVPEEVLPYLEALIHEQGISTYIVFRPYADGFESWLKLHHPEILERVGEDHIFRNGIKEGLPVCDVVVGSHSTAVLEALLELKPMVFFATGKWGDYFNLRGYDQHMTLYAENVEDFVDAVKESMHIPTEVLKKLQERFFGDPYQNGSAWVVDQLEGFLDSKH